MDPELGRARFVSNYLMTRTDFMSAGGAAKPRLTRGMFMLDTGTFLPRRAAIWIGPMFAWREPRVTLAQAIEALPTQVGRVQNEVVAVLRMEGEFAA